MMQLNFYANTTKSATPPSRNRYLAPSFALDLKWTKLAASLTRQSSRRRGSLQNASKRTLSNRLEVPKGRQSFQLKSLTMLTFPTRSWEFAELVATSWTVRPSFWMLRRQIVRNTRKSTQNTSTLTHLRRWVWYVLRQTSSIAANWSHWS